MSGSASPSSYRQQLRAFKTRKYLKREGPMLAEDRMRLESLSPLELAFAAINPDHSPEGQTAAQDLLEQRDGDAPSTEIVVPGFVPASWADDLQRRFFGIRRLVRKWSGAVALLGFVGVIVAVGIAEELKDPALRAGVEAGLITEAEYAERGRRLTREEYDAAEAKGIEFDSAFASDATLEEVLLPRVADLPEGRRQARAESAGWAVIVVLCLSGFGWILTSTYRRHPGRLLLLRKFNDRELAKSMERVITDQLRPFGHIITLSDKHIRQSFWEGIGGMIPTNFLHLALVGVWLPLRIVLRCFNRSKFGPAYVGSARDFRNLARRLRDRIGLNSEVAFTSKEAFIVRSSDSWWQQIVALMMNSADVIVVDLSHVTSGTAWELERLESRGIFRRAVLLAREDRHSHAREALARFPSLMDQPVYLYDKLGEMEQREEFRAAMLQSIRNTLEQRPQPAG